MLKRLAAFLFILTIAGQVYAGVCGCVGGDNQPKHSCCKRQRSVRDSVSRKGCCNTECMTQRSEKLVQDRTEPFTKIKFEAVKELAEVPKLAFERLVRSDAGRIPPFTNHRLQYSRPPELFLRHCAFLI